MLSGGVANLQKAEDLGGTIPDSVGTKQADARMKTTALCFLHRIYHDVKGKGNRKKGKSTDKRGCYR